MKPLSAGLLAVVLVLSSAASPAAGDPWTHFSPWKEAGRPKPPPNMALIRRMMQLENQLRPMVNSDEQSKMHVARAKVLGYNPSCPTDSCEETRLQHRIAELEVQLAHAQAARKPR